MTKPAPVRVRRVVTTRAGGRSSGAYSSFNLGDHVGDDPSAVAANRRRLAEGIGVPPQRLVWMEQVHSRTVAVVDGPLPGPLAATDAVVTAARELALVVVAADCVPVLLADEESGVIAAAHAGRVGARIGILGATLGAMRSLGARTERISVLLGPAVCGQCYEVSEPMQRDVEAHVPDSASRTRAGTAGLDIRAGLRRALLAEGVGAVAQDPRCTMESEELFSHRRQAPTGRLAGVIWTESP